MKLELLIDGGNRESLSPREVGYLKQSGYIVGGANGQYRISDTVPNGWTGICSILAKQKR